MSVTEPSRKHVHQDEQVISTRRHLDMQYTVGGTSTITVTLNNGHLQTTDTNRWSKAVHYMEVPLYIVQVVIYEIDFLLYS